MTSKRNQIDVQNDCECYSDVENFTPIFWVSHDTLQERTSPLLHKYARFWYINRGRAMFRIQGRVIELSAGDLVGILPYQCTEIIEVSEELDYDIVIYEYDIVNSIIKNNMNTLNGDFDFSDIIYSNIFVSLNGKHQQSIKRIINEMYSEIHNMLEQKDYPYVSFILSNLVVQIIILFHKTSKIVQQKKRMMKNKIEMFHYLFFNLNNKPSLKQLARRYYMSESAISKYIYDTIGVSYSQLIATMKISRLMNSLHYTDNSLQELAILLGFVDAAHVSNYFKSKTGFSPKEFRDSKRNNKHNKLDSFHQVLNFVLDNYTENLTVEYISNEFNIPINRVNELFRFFVEKDFHDFVNYVRVIKASEKLLSTEDNVSEIAFEVGYNTVRTFNRNFYNYFKLSPLEFRKKTDFQSTPL